MTVEWVNGGHPRSRCSDSRFRISFSVTPAWKRSCEASSFSFLRSLSWMTGTSFAMFSLLSVSSAMISSIFLVLNDVNDLTASTKPEAVHWSSTRVQKRRMHLYEEMRSSIMSSDCENSSSYCLSIFSWCVRDPRCPSMSLKTSL